MAKTKIKKQSSKQSSHSHLAAKGAGRKPAPLVSVRRLKECQPFIDDIFFTVLAYYKEGLGLDSLITLLSVQISKLDNIARPMEDDETLTKIFNNLELGGKHGRKHRSRSEKNYG